MKATLTCETDEAIYTLRGEINQHWFCFEGSCSTETWNESDWQKSWNPGSFGSVYVADLDKFAGCLDECRRMHRTFPGISFELKEAPDANN